MKSRIVLLVTSAIAIMALGGTTAHAKTLAIGNPLTGPDYSDSMFTGPPDPCCTAVNAKLISGADGASPTDGTVITWAVGNPHGAYAPTVIQPNPNGTYTGVVAGPTVALNNPASASPTQSTNLPIKAGQLFALSLSGHIYESFTGGLGGYSEHGPLTPGVTDNLTGGLSVDNYAFTATIRYCEVPNVVGQTVATATQTLASSDCTLGQVIKAKRKKKKVKKSKAPKVTRQSVAPGTKISDTAPIDLTFAKKKKKRKK